MDLYLFRNRQGQFANEYLRKVFRILIVCQELIIPDYYQPGLRPFSGIQCDRDEERGCDVCVCENTPHDPNPVHDYETGAYDDEAPGP